MELTRSEKSRHQAISGGIALALLAVFLLVLLYYSLEAGNHNETVSAKINSGSVSQLLAISSENVAETPVHKQQSSSETTSTRNLLTSHQESPVETPEKSDAGKLADQFKQHRQSAGLQPAGSSFPESEGLVPSGREVGDTEVVSPRVQFSLKGRTIVKVPEPEKVTGAVGKVVVEIEVDKYGNVTMADPNGRGTTTTNVMLRVKARQAALATKFNESKTMETQRGMITFLFSYK